jgi:hypothetical protein
MARRRIIQPKSQDAAATAQSDTSQQDEADISREMGAEAGPDGELLADEAAVRKAGAVDVESVRENRRMTRAVHNKRTGKANIHINVDDVLIKYDQTLRLYAADTIYITVKRVNGGSPVQHTITSAPRNGAALYEAIRAIHGRHEEAAYAVSFFDPTNKAWRGKGQITMPDTQGQPSMGYPPYGQQPPPGYQPQPQAPAAPPPPQTPDLGTLLTGFQKLQDLLQTYQMGGPVQPPVSVPGDAVSAQFDQLQQMLDMLRQSQGGRGPARVPVAPAAAPAMNPQMAAAMMGMGMPPVQPPPGTIWVPGFGFVSLEMLMQALAGMGGGRPVGGLGPRSPFRSSFAAGPVAGDDHQQQQSSPYRGPAYAAAQANQQGPQERTAAQAFRDSVSLIRTASDAAKELQSLFPGQEAQEPIATVSIEDEDSPMRVIDAGGARLVVNKKDGSLRTWETGFANMDKIFKWAGEQLEMVRQAPRPPPVRQALPPGVVEVHPGYQPPPGYVPVPLDPSTGAPQFEQALPPPPSNLPPPLGGFARPPAPRQPAPAPRPAAAPAPAPAPAKRPWGPPPMPPRQ